MRLVALEVPENSELQKKKAKRKKEERETERGRRKKGTIKETQAWK